MSPVRVCFIGPCWRATASVVCSTGGWRPLNSDGLVFANPEAAPRQAYSWLVLPDLTVASFVDDWGRGRDAQGVRRFGATFAPTLRLRLAGDTAGLET